MSLRKIETSKLYPCGVNLHVLHNSKSCCHCIPSTTFRVHCCSLIALYSNGPAKKWSIVSVRLISVAHCTYFMLSGVTPGLNKMRSPYIIVFEIGHVVYSYQSGHHWLNSSLFLLSPGCLAKKIPKYCPLSANVAFKLFVASISIWIKYHLSRSVPSGVNLMKNDLLFDFVICVHQCSVWCFDGLSDVLWYMLWFV